MFIYFAYFCSEFLPHTRPHTHTKCEKYDASIVIIKLFHKITYLKYLVQVEREIVPIIYIDFFMLKITKVINPV